LVASSAASAVRAKTLKKRAAQIDVPGVAVGPGEPGEVEKWKKVAQINVGDRSACGEDD
jgi:hypothetical protein